MEYLEKLYFKKNGNLLKKQKIELIQGDCLEKMKDIPEGSVDMVLTDPPYGTTACKRDSVIPFDEMWEQLKRIIKPNGVIVMTASQPFTTTLISSNIKMFKYCWMWDKSQVTNFLNSKKQPLRRIEDVVVFYKKQCTYNPQMKSGKPYKIRRTHEIQIYGLQKESYTENNGERYPDGVIDIPQIRTKKGHPTQKPVALMEYLIKTYTNEGETVLDFAMGSGTTGVACKNLNRNFIGIELDQKYFKIAEKRINENTSLSL